MSLELMLRERKRRKMARKLGVSIEQLQKPPVLGVNRSTNPTAPSPAKLDFEIAKYRFTLNHLSMITPDILSVSQVVVEPEEIQVPTARGSEKSTDEGPTEETLEPLESMFFQLPSPQKVTTDEQLYEEFKRNYIAQGIEDSFVFCRRNQRRRKCVGNRSSQMSRRRV